MKKQMPKKKPTGGSKRKISQVKRSNIKRNKLVKAGKAKPQGKPRYIPGQKNKEDKEPAEKRPQLSTAQQQAKQAENDEEREAGLQELADQLLQEDKEFIKKINRKRKLGGEDDEDSEDDDHMMEAMERGAIARIHSEKDTGGKKMKPMLPIKTKDGVKERHIEVEEEEEEPEEEEEEEGGAEEDDAEEGGVEDHPVVPGEEISVVEIYARRKELLTERKIQIGSLATNFLEVPEERIINLEKLLKFVDAEEPESVQHSVHRLAAASVLEVLKDVTPGYRIFHQDTGEKLKKETLKLYKYESGLLKCYKGFLLKLEKRINMFKKTGTEKKSPLDIKQAEFFLSCMCQLLVAHPHFNFATNILHAVCPILTSAHAAARTTVKNAVEEVFKGDMRGEISMEATKLINHLVKTRKHNVRPEVVDVLRSLRIKNVNLDQEKDEEMNLKKKEARKQKLLEKNNISRQEKKRKKKLELLEKELLEAKGEEGKKVKEKFFTEATKVVFTIYFRILKSFPRSNLMGSVLEGLAKFAHVINYSFFSDLITVFQSLLTADFLTHRDSLLVVSTVFTILSGQGEALNIDPASFYTHLYNHMFQIDAISSHEELPLATKALVDMLIRRKKRVSKARVLAFCKRLSTLSLQVLHHGSIACLGLLRQLVNTHSVALQLLDSQHEVGSGVFDPSIGDPEHCSATNTTAWELTLLLNHYHAPTAKMAKHVAAQCPSSGELSLSQDLKMGVGDLFTSFSMEEMAFNPPIKPPAKKNKRLFTNPSFSTNLDDIKLAENLDFFKAVTS